MTARLGQTEESTEPGLGTSLALASNFMVLGHPNAGNGEVLTYSRSGSATEYTSVGVVVSSIATERFGDAVDMAVLANNVPAILVGATKTLASFEERGEQVVVGYGSAHYLTFSGSSWNEVGGPIRGSLALEEAGGGFGQAVAMATTVQRIVVGAPSSSQDLQNLDTGKVYTFTYNEQAWVTTGSVMEGTASSKMGSSLDLSPDGSRLLVGAPGNGTADGKFSFHEWTGSNWNTVFEEAGSPSASFGMALQFVNPNASRFAVGGPTANSGEGVVVVYSESPSSNPTSFVRLGEPIRGASGEGIGQTVCGNGELIAFGTNSGEVRMYSFSNGSWLEVGSFDTGSEAPLSCSISDDLTRIAVGTGSKAQVYELSFSET